jgi:hypothetical protein
MSASSIPCFLAAIEVDVIQSDSHQLADAYAGVQQGLDEHEVGELARFPNRLVVATDLVLAWYVR